MSIDLTNTNASKIAGGLIRARREAGSPTMGMVLTFIVVADEGSHYDALKAARAVSREHPSRVIGVIRRSARGPANLDAEIRIGDGSSGEQVLLRMSGELAHHPESVVLPLLLPDSPTVIWWPSRPPDNPATDPLGALAQRRITDAAAVDRRRAAAMLKQASNYAPGNTDLSWTRITPWRALLAAALDQYPAKVLSGVVAAERGNPSADLLVAWLTDRLKVDIHRSVSRGPGITDVSLMTGGGEIDISRPDGRLAQFTIPNSPQRPVALNRRDLAELLAEELRRLDPDDVYEDTVKTLCRISDNVPALSERKLAALQREADEAAARVGTPPTEPGPRIQTDDEAGPEEPGQDRTATQSAGPTKRAAAKKSTAKKSTAKKSTAKTSAARKSTARKSTAKKSTAKKSSAAARKRASSS
jgi:glucose-6-phosphate dehydrogenase assembly protein OpcA